MNEYKKAIEVIDTLLHLMCGEEREDGYKPTMEEMSNSMDLLKELVDKVDSLETLEELGYKKNVENGEITYSQNFGSEYFKIIFDLSENKIEIETDMEVVIEDDLLLAINQQCKELGWI